MSANRSSMTRAGVLIIGLVLGWGLDCLTRRGSVVRANGGDRAGESILASGPVMVGYNNGTKVQLPLDAIYYLDYRMGRLLATIPSFKASIGTAKLLDTFGERDLVADFKLNLDKGPQPHFLMTTGSLGTYSDGWAPLYVFETTTGQVAVYKVEQQTVGAQTTPKFELVELRALPAPSPLSVDRANGGDRAGESILASGPVMVGYNNGTRVQLPLDAIYYLDYKVFRLLATIPSFKASVGTAKLLDTFGERDLVADFKLNLDNGPRPQFMMTTGSLGTYSDGWAPLYVFEKTTGQVAVYKVEQQTVGARTTPKFELMEIRALPAPTPAPESR